MIAKTSFLFGVVLLSFALPGAAETTISPRLFFSRTSVESRTARIAGVAVTSPVTLRFSTPPSQALLDSLETAGVAFTRIDGFLYHTASIYPAVIMLDSLDALRNRFPSLASIAEIANPSRTSTLDVSRVVVRADRVPTMRIGDSTLDGTGVLVADIDSGVDIYHPAFFKPDGGVYSWIDTNANGIFDAGVDAVDLDRDTIAEASETLALMEAFFLDPLGIMSAAGLPRIYDADIDWLYNDSNGSGSRESGPEAGYTESSPCFGERFFVIDDRNANNRLDPGESLTSLGTSKIVAIYDASGIHRRGENLFTSEPDLDNHGTAAVGIVGGEVSGRRFAGIAPGVEFICVNRASLKDSDKIIAGTLWAVDNGADIVMYEFGSWVYEYLDGSSDLEILIKELATGDYAGKTSSPRPVPQLTASGNLAGATRKRHARITLSTNQTGTIRFNAPPAPDITSIYLSLLWRGRTTYFPSSLKLTFPNGVTYSLLQYGGTFTTGSQTLDYGVSYSSNGTSRLDMQITSPSAISGDFSLYLNNRRSITLTYDAYIADNKTSWMNGAAFLDFVTDDGTITSPGTAEHTLTVGAYDPRGKNAPLGAICTFSSWGLTIDGRRAVDITAPGYTVFSPGYQTHPAQTAQYRDFNGTSAALPFLAGVYALALQASPSLTQSSFESILASTAIHDAETNSLGALPNTIWGYGKLSIRDLLIASGAPLAVEAPFSPYANPTVITISPPHPNPFNGVTRCTVSWLLPSQACRFSVYSITGQLVNQLDTTAGTDGIASYTWNGLDAAGRTVSSGVYLIRFETNKNSATRLVTYLR